jgi:hypothetical protein
MTASGRGPRSPDSDKAQSRCGSSERTNLGILLSCGQLVIAQPSTEWDTWLVTGLALDRAMVLQTSNGDQPPTPEMKRQQAMLSAMSLVQISKRAHGLTEARYSMRPRTHTAESLHFS